MNAIRHSAWLLAVTLALAFPAASLSQESRSPAWRDLSGQQRADLAQFARSWDGMSERRREIILRRHARWQQLPEHSRETLREGARNFARLTPPLREKMRLSIIAVRSLPLEEQRQLRRLWRSLTPRQRRDWLERGGPGIAPPR